VFGSWSGILVLGFGGIASLFQALKNDRAALDVEKSQEAQRRAELDAQFEEEKAKVEKQRRLNLASAAAVAGEWKKFHIAQEEEFHTELVRSETEKVWSKTFTQQFDKKTMHVVENAVDLRWREVHDQGTTLELFRERNKIKEKEIMEKRARRAERSNSQKDELDNEKSNLQKLTGEIDTLKMDLEKMTEENKKKAQEKLQEMKDREALLKKKEEKLEQSHKEKLEKLKKRYQTLTSLEERFESGEERKKYQEISEKLESAQLNVAKFNEKVMQKEKQKSEEFKMKEKELKQREKELTKMADTIATVANGFMVEMVDVDARSYTSLLDMPEDELMGTPSKRDKSAKSSLPKISEVKPSTACLMDLDEDDEDEERDPAGNSTQKKGKEGESRENDDNESTASSCLLNRNSDNDSLSYQIEQDIAASKREHPNNTPVGKPTDGEMATGPSPLQEKNTQRGTSTVLYRDDDSDATSDPFNALTVSPTKSSDADHVVLNKKTQKENGASLKVERNSYNKASFNRTKRKKGRKQMVVSEPAAVEVIEWSQHGGSRSVMSSVR